MVAGLDFLIVHHCEIGQDVCYRITEKVMRRICLKFLGKFRLDKIHTGHIASKQITPDIISLLQTTYGFCLYDTAAIHGP